MKKTATTLLLVAATAGACDIGSDNTTPTGIVLSDPQAEGLADLYESWAERETQCCGFAFEWTPLELDSLPHYVSDWGLELDLECAAPPESCEAPPLERACEAPCKTGFGAGAPGSACDTIANDQFYADTCQQGLVCLEAALGLPSQCIDPCEPRIGDLCNVDRPCGSGAICLAQGEDPYLNDRQGHCVEAPALGEPCDPHSGGCARNEAFCNTEDYDQPICDSMRDLGESCTLWAQCKTGYCGPDGGGDWLETPSVCMTQEFPECANNVDGV